MDSPENWKRLGAQVSKHKKKQRNILGQLHAKTRQRIISVNIQKAPDGHDLRLALPHGPNLTKGGSLYIDKKKSLDFQVITHPHHISYIGSDFS